jgi:hypothetical protein
MVLEVSGVILCRGRFVSAIYCLELLLLTSEAEVMVVSNHKQFIFFCLYVYNLLNNFSATWWLSPLLVTGLQI